MPLNRGFFWSFYEINYFFLCFNLISCLTLFPKINQILKTNTNYKKDIIIRHSGVEYEGVAVLPHAKEYNLEIEARDNLDMFILTTCNRDWTKEKSWNIKTQRRFFRTRRIAEKTKTSFIYRPNELESEGFCPVEIIVATQKSGKHSWGFIDRMDKGPMLPAHVICNGLEYDSKGVTVCQSRSGLIQRIVFKSNVLVSPDEGCPISDIKGLSFDIILKEGKCTYAFMDASNGLIHRFTAYGYKEILIRE